MNGLLDLFGWPLALCSLVAVPVAVALARREVARRRDAVRALGGPSAGRSRERLHVVSVTVLVVAVALAAVAFARPRWGAQEIPLEQRGIDVVVVLDVSRSMLAQDIQPSRAEASSAAVASLLTHLQGNRVGLVTFAGTAFPRSPLTLDIDAVRTLAGRAQAESALVRPGSDIAGAVTAGLALLDIDDKATSQAVLVITDGEVQEGDITAIAGVSAKARAAGVRIYGGFAGREEPVALPASSGGTDVTRAQRTPLVALTEQTGGLLRDVAQVPGFAIEFRHLQQTRFAEESRRASVERYQWFAGAALALLVFQLVLPAASTSQVPRLGMPPRWRRRRASRTAGVTTMALAVLLLSGCTALLGTPVYRAVAEGNRLYAAGDYEGALAAYDRAAALDEQSPAIAYNRGLALHRLTRYDESYRATIEGIKHATDVGLGARMEYSAGNSAFLLEKATDARDRYIAALRLDPEDTDAKANLELLLSRISPGNQPGDGNDGQQPQTPSGDQQPQPEQDGPQVDGQQQPGQQPGGQAGQQPGQQPGRAGGQSQPGTPGQQGDPSSDSADGDPTTAAEAQAALEAALSGMAGEVTREQALRILELARLANALERPRPQTPTAGPPPPR